ncbi:LysR family transcriptional regulator ArgP [Frondihabitans peucedani]|uniref:LysR family transcriptional regulator ArgP n=1 Tax=Frondihabitans peucedani TaxID=598626 RepID=A0ABP8E2Z4_9MICO
MQLDHLETLSALVDEGTFEAAARRLHVSASAVSQRVKAMEASTGRVLVRRTTPVTLTDAGEVILRYARQVELLETDTQRALEGSQDGAGGGSGSATGGRVSRIALAVNADSLATWFLGALSGLGDELGVVFDLHREDQVNTTRLLRAGTVMAAVTSTRDAVQGCTTEALGAMRYRAVCAPDFAARWGLRDPASSALAEAPVVLFDRDDDLQSAFVRARTGSGATGPRHYIPTSDDFARAVALGFGWGVLPEQQCAGPIAEGSLVELAPADPVDVALHWQRWNIASPTLDRITAAVRSGAAGSLR